MHKWALILLFALNASAEIRKDFQRYENCTKKDAICGQCENAALVPTSTILKEWLGKKKTITEMLGHLIQRTEASLGQKLIPIYLGQSPSLMSATKDHPKVILKSPESEILIAFNTDPKSKAFQSLELIRFDGLNAKFITEKVFLDRKKQLQVATNPSECIRCHGKNNHPLWDTYRAWPGMWTGRDDLVEKNSNTAELIIDLLKKIESRVDPRLNWTTPTISAEKIQEKLIDSEWARIPHFPAVDELKNTSLRTAKFAGPGHVLFDQLSANVGCAMAHEMKSILSPNEVTTLKELLQTWKVGESLLPAKYYSQEWGRHFNRISEAHRKDQAFKVKRQMAWLESLGIPKAEAWYDAFKRQVDFVKDWFAVPDPGGVLGIDEYDAEILALAEIYLSRQGHSLSEWSMSVSPVLDPDFKSFSFSDQWVRSLQSAGF